MAEKEYLYMIDALDIYSADGNPMPPIQGHALVLYDTPPGAYGKLFRKGFFNLISNEGIFVDNDNNYVREVFDGPYSLNTLMSESPYSQGLFAQYPLSDLQFERLSVTRYSLPNIPTTIEPLRKSTKVRTVRRNRRTRRTRRTMRTRRC